MGLAMGDYDHDGFFDYFQTNFSGDYNTLRRNLGKGVFRDVSYSSGVALPSWQLLGWGTGFFDYDNDGWEDLFVANGHVYPQVDRYPIDITFAEPKLVYRNLGNGKFADVTAQLGGGLTSPWSSRGAAFADFDNDGDVDVAVNNLGARPSLFLNEGGNRSGNWLVIELVAKTGNHGATGARVTVETPQTRQMQEATAGNSYQASNDCRLHFGLGASPSAKSVVIRWPDGEFQRFEAIASNNRYSLTQGKQLAVTQAKRE
jgi:enediyne biosynthesis protein E4